MRAGHEEIESPFASFADLLTGIVVIFILLASILALNQKVSESELEERRVELMDQIERLHEERDALRDEIVSEEARLEALQEELSRDQEQALGGQHGTGQPSGLLALLATVQAGLAERGLPEVTISRGAVELPESVLFDRGSDVIRNNSAIRQLRATLEQVLPCMSSGMPQRGCPSDFPRLQVVLIEGHADTTGDERSNQILSIRRAISVYDALLQSDLLAAARPYGSAADGPSLFAIAGYGETSLAVPTGDGIDEPRNRRIEIRFVLQEQDS